MPHFTLERFTSTNEALTFVKAFARIYSAQNNNEQTARMLAYQTAYLQNDTQH